MHATDHSARTTRIAALLGVGAGAVNLAVAWAWFEALAWLLVGFYWAVVGLLVAVDGAVWIVALLWAHRGLARWAAWGGLGTSVLELNPLSVVVHVAALGLLYGSNARSSTASVQR